jgi:hypothetical protein
VLEQHLFDEPPESVGIAQRRPGSVTTLIVSVPSLKSGRNARPAPASARRASANVASATLPIVRQWRSVRSRRRA